MSTIDKIKFVVFFYTSTTRPTKRPAGGGDAQKLFKTRKKMLRKCDQAPVDVSFSGKALQKLYLFFNPYLIQLWTEIDTEDTLKWVLTNYWNR